MTSLALMNHSMSQKKMLTVSYCWIAPSTIQTYGRMVRRICTESANRADVGRRRLEIWFWGWWQWVFSHASMDGIAPKAESKVVPKDHFKALRWCITWKIRFALQGKSKDVQGDSNRFSLVRPRFYFSSTLTPLSLNSIPKPEYYCRILSWLYRASFSCLCISWAF